MYTTFDRDTDELLNNTKHEKYMTFLYFVSAVCAFLTSENNYISTNPLNPFELFSNRLFRYTAIPLYNLTQFGPIHIQQTWVRLTHQKTTSLTSHYPICPNMSSSENISHLEAIECVLFVFNTRKLTYFPVSSSYYKSETWCECGMKSVSNRCLEKSCFWLLLFLWTCR